MASKNPTAGLTKPLGGQEQQWPGPRRASTALRLLILLHPPHLLLSLRPILPCKLRPITRARPLAPQPSFPLTGSFSPWPELSSLSLPPPLRLVCSGGPSSPSPPVQPSAGGGPAASCPKYAMGHSGGGGEACNAHTHFGIWGGVGALGGAFCGFFWL